MACPHCNDRGYFQMRVNDKSDAVINIECDHKVADSDCTICNGTGRDMRLGIPMECRCRRRAS